MRNRTHKNRRNKRCGEKRCYLTREDACHNMLLLAGTTGTGNLSCYRCEDCKEWHVGHMPMSIRERYQLT